MLTKSSKIFVAGHRGMVGAAILNALIEGGYESLVTASRSELDLTSQSETGKFFSDVRPDAVIVAAARVGGIRANHTYPAEFIYENLMIECNCIHQAHLNDVERLLFLGSSCIYPKEAPQPMSESALLAGPLEPTNEPYAVAKIAGIKLCESYSRQHNCDFRSIMPTNLYGPGDNFHPDNSHVIPALVRRFHESKKAKESRIGVWGTGHARREFLHVDDLAQAALFVLELPPHDYAACVKPQLSHINVGQGNDITISELATLISEIVGYVGEITFDDSKPDGPEQKLLDTSLINGLGWSPEISLREGLTDTYDWFQRNQHALRS